MSPEEALAIHYSKMTPEERALHVDALIGGEVIWARKDREPWSKPQFIPEGHPLHPDYKPPKRSRALGDDEEVDDGLGKYKLYDKLAKLNAEENLKSFAEKMTPEEVANAALLDGAVVELGPLVKGMVGGEKCSSPFKDLSDDPKKLEALLDEAAADLKLFERKDDLKNAPGQVNSLPPLTAGMAPRIPDEEVSKLFEKKFSLTQSDLEKIVRNTIANIEAEKAHAAADKIDIVEHNVVEGTGEGIQLAPSDCVIEGSTVLTVRESWWERAWNFIKSVGSNSDGLSG